MKPKQLLNISIHTILHVQNLLHHEEVSEIVYLLQDSKVLKIAKKISIINNVNE